MSGYLDTTFILTEKSQHQKSMDYSMKTLTHIVDY